MIVINKEIKKKFCEKVNKLKTENEKLEYIKNRYKAEEFEFHRILLHSGQVNGFEISTINKLIIFIKSIEIENKKIIEEDLNFLQYLMQKKNMYFNKIKAYINKNHEKIYADDLLNYLEYLNLNKEENVCSLNGKQYPKDILNSQYNHVLDSFSGIVELIRNHNIPRMNSKIRKINSLCNEIYQLEGKQYSIKQLANATMMELYKPKKFNNYNYEGINFGIVYEALNNPSYWPVLEIYRDLNFTHIVNDEINVNDDLNLAKKATFIKTSYGDDIMHIDYEKGDIWILERDIYQAYKLISPMYGDKDTKFSYKNKKYEIDDLLSIYSAIQKYILQNKDKWINKFKSDKNCSLIGVFGERELLRLIGLSSDKIDLLELLAYDISGKDKPELLNYKPLIRMDKIYYILPTWIDNISLDRAIDKILSDKSLVQVNLLEQTKKGFLFEDTIEMFFKSCNIKFFKTKRDEENGIPEIDGMFIIDEYLFIFEAKASIKPGSIMEAYNNLNSKLAKAKKQLDERMNILLNDKERTSIIEKKIQFNISGLKVVPFVLLNHNFFNGYLDLTNDSGDNYYPIIDFSTLKQIIINRKAPCWKYNDEKCCYKRSEVALTTGEELETYLKYQINYLISYEKPTFQMLEDKIIFRIVKPLGICN